MNSINLMILSAYFICFGGSSRQCSTKPWAIEFDALQSCGESDLMQIDTHALSSMHFICQRLAHWPSCCFDLAELLHLLCSIIFQEYRTYRCNGMLQPILEDSLSSERPAFEDHPTQTRESVMWSAWGLHSAEGLSRKHVRRSKHMTKV